MGDAYRLAYQKGIIPITITSFELLRDTLKWCKENGYTYIGHCCYEFYEKRYEVFKGTKGVLLDIVGTTCYSLGVEEEERAYHGEFTVELDLIKDTMENSLRIKEDGLELRKESLSFDFSLYFSQFIPPYYKKPKAVPSPLEDRTRVAVQKEVFLGEATIDGKAVSYQEAFETLAEWLEKSQKPTLIVGPLLFWDWADEELRKKAEAVMELVRKIEKLQVKVLPDYRPKLKKYDPSLEMDPPNPHETVLHDQNDLTLLIGVHCYRTDFVIRLLKKHTKTKVVALCGLYGHPEADLSTSFTDAEKVVKLLKVI